MGRIDRCSKFNLGLRCEYQGGHNGTCAFVPQYIDYVGIPAAKPGIGGAPSRATTLPTDSTQRKDYPIATGFLDYFPDAIVELSRLSKLANDQHNPDKPMHWDRSKSQNEDDTMMRHFLQRGTRDTDGTRHSTRMAWRALAFLQKEIEGETK